MESLLLLPLLASSRRLPEGHGANRTPLRSRRLNEERERAHGGGSQGKPLPVPPPPPPAGDSRSRAGDNNVADTASCSRAARRGQRGVMPPQDTPAEYCRQAVCQQHAGRLWTSP